MFSEGDRRKENPSTWKSMMLWPALYVGRDPVLEWVPWKATKLPTTTRMNNTPLQKACLQLPIQSQHPATHRALEFIWFLQAIIAIQQSKSLRGRGVSSSEGFSCQSTSLICSFWQQSWTTPWINHSCEQSRDSGWQVLVWTLVPVKW